MATRKKNETKVCSHCLRRMPVSDFYTQRTRSDGSFAYSSNCRICQREICKINYRKRKSTTKIRTQRKTKKTKAAEKKSKRTTLCEFIARTIQNELEDRAINQTTVKAALSKIYRDISIKGAIHCKNMTIDVMKEANTSTLARKNTFQLIRGTKLNNTETEHVKTNTKRKTKRR